MLEIAYLSFKKSKIFWGGIAYMHILNKHFATTGEKLAGLLNSHYVPTVELIDRISPTVMEIEIQEENVKENLLN